MPQNQTPPALQYQLICHPDQEQFEKLVTEAMNDGWKMTGGVFVLRVPNAHPDGMDEDYFYQAMTIDRRLPAQ